MHECHGRAARWRTVASQKESAQTKAQQEQEELMVRSIASEGGKPAQVKEGWLNKRSIGNRVMHNWKKRFFRLSYYGKLVYYIDDGENSAAKGSIVLTWDMTLEESDSEDRTTRQRARK